MPDTPFRLDDKVAVVTGAARGIARAGAYIAGIDIVGAVSSIDDFAPATETELADTGHAVEATGRRWLAIHLDQRDMGALRAASDRIVTVMGGIDILFANAGIQASNLSSRWKMPIGRIRSTST